MNDSIIDHFFGAPQDAEGHCGYVALAGRPNVGKSTLMNQVLGVPLSIVSHKPQTTRHRIAGIHSTDKGQIVFIDMPGIHIPEKQQAINRYLNRIATASLQDVDIVCFLCEAGRWTAEDDLVLERLQQVDTPVWCVINKIDRLDDRSQLLPFIETLRDRFQFAEYFPLSAKKGEGVPEWEQALLEHLPFGKPLYDPEQLTDRSERFLAAEFIREQLTVRLHREIPYQLTVEIQQWERKSSHLHIAAVIWVQRDSQKKIVIGKQGQVLKQVGQAARLRLEKMLGEKIFLQLWVKVKQGWADDERALRQLGYEDS